MIILDKTQNLYFTTDFTKSFRVALLVDICESLKVEIRHDLTIKMYDSFFRSITTFWYFISAQLLVIRLNKSKIMNFS